jgi:hypothetical protein
MSATQADGESLRTGFALLVSAVATFLLFAVVVSFFLGVPLVAGLFNGLPAAIAWSVVIGAAVYIGYASDGISWSFFLTGIALLLLASEVLPDALTQPFSVITGTLLGTQLGNLNPVAFGVLSLATITVVWVFQIRVFGQPKSPGPVANRLRSRFESLASEWGTVLRVLGVTVIAVAFTFFSELGDLAGELFRYLAGAPVISGYAGTLLAGFGTFVADLPVLGTLSGTQFGLIAVGIFAIAVGAKFTGVLDN